MNTDTFEVKVPSYAKRIQLEIVPTEDGEYLSIIGIKKMEIRPPNKFEKLIGLVFKLSNVVTEVINIAKIIDNSIKIEVINSKGYFKQEIALRILSNQFTIGIKKSFSGGTKEDDMMNYLISLDISCMFKEHADLIELHLMKNCPKPLNRYELNAV